jgi:hypothetical protein
MKKLFFLIILTILIAGCSSEFYKHDSVFKDWDRVQFSWWDYQNPTAEHAKMYAQRGWWGEEIPYILAK